MENNTVVVQSGGKWWAGPLSGVIVVCLWENTNIQLTVKEE
ncbi:hypothetical protein GGQ84_001161 [Desulfitispora alkaliphila]